MNLFLLYVLLLLIVIFCIILFLMYVFFSRKMRKEKELCQQKIDEFSQDSKDGERQELLEYFTSTFRDIRTPLSLIIAPMESIRNERKTLQDKGFNTEEIDSALDVMERNTMRLADLINQMQTCLSEQNGNIKPEPLLPEMKTSFQAVKPLEMTADAVAEEQEDEEAADQPAMLIVEDDLELCEYIVSHFKDQYRIFAANNGVMALKVLEEQQISLIVSDWMMPEMDGVELCTQVRKNSATSHIPFILLTAKTDNDSKAESMDCGVDAFIEKPFSMKYLKACIRNLIETRRMLQTKYSHSPLEPISQVTGNRMDNEFLVNMNKLIEDNLNNPYMSVIFLAEQMGISRSTLFAKTKALVNVTPNEMIQIVKLKKAASLLKEGNYRVNEVCYMVGFSSPSYFAKCFQKQFGMKPGEFMEQR